jgi:hypothetical protein
MSYTEDCFPYCIYNHVIFKNKHPSVLLLAAPHAGKICLFFLAYLSPSQQPKQTLNEIKVMQNDYKL